MMHGQQNINKLFLKFSGQDYALTNELITPGMFGGMLD
jgi:hypothetical protein